MINTRAGNRTQISPFGERRLVHWTTRAVEQRGARNRFTPSVSTIPACTERLQSQVVVDLLARAPAADCARGCIPNRPGVPGAEFAIAANFGKFTDFLT